MEQTSLQSNPETESKILTLEQFNFRNEKSGTPKYNNFYLYFSANTSGESYRQDEHYKKFALEHPEIVKSLSSKIESRNKNWKEVSTSESLIPFDRDLYESYKIMRSYGISDEDLFA